MEPRAASPSARISASFTSPARRASQANSISPPSNRLNSSRRQNNARRARRHPDQDKIVRMASKVSRVTVDLSGYPELVVIYLGMRVNSLRGLATLFGFGPKIKASVDAQPDGLLLHENFLFSV